MPRIEAIIRTVEARIRPVLMTTITTMAGLTPMMLGISLDFANGGYSVDSPTALWWKQLATAVVFGLGVATVLTLMLTPALLALRVWIEKGAYRGALGLRWVLANATAPRGATGRWKRSCPRVRGSRVDLGYRRAIRPRPTVSRRAARPKCRPAARRAPRAGKR